MTRSDRKDQPRTQWQAAASFEAAHQAQFVAGLAATPAQRLAWLEEMLEIAYRSGALQRAYRERYGEGPWGAEPTPPR